jgi:hypothetical protein
MLPFAMLPTPGTQIRQSPDLVSALVILGPRCGGHRGCPVLFTGSSSTSGPHERLLPGTSPPDSPCCTASSLASASLPGTSLASLSFCWAQFLLPAESRSHPQSEKGQRPSPRPEASRRRSMSAYPQQETKD